MVNTPPIIGTRITSACIHFPFSSRKCDTQQSNSSECRATPCFITLKRKTLRINTLYQSRQTIFEFWDSLCAVLYKFKVYQWSTSHTRTKKIMCTQKAQVTTYSNGEKNVSSSDPDVMDNIMIQIKGWYICRLQRDVDGRRIQNYQKRCRTVFSWYKKEHEVVDDKHRTILHKWKNIQIPLKNAVGEFQKKFSVAGIPFDSYVQKLKVMSSTKVS